MRDRERERKERGPVCFSSKEKEIRREKRRVAWLGVPNKQPEKRIALSRSEERRVGKECSW